MKYYKTILFILLAFLFSLSINCSSSRKVKEPGVKKWTYFKIYADADDAPIFVKLQDDLSAAATIMDAERSLVSGMTGATDELLAYSRGLTPFTTALNDINTQLAKLATDVVDLVQSVGRTGLYIHLLGMDGSLHNNQEFVNAAGRALLDITDPGRPTPEGEMTFFLGLVMMFGAPNPLGLKGQFKSIGTVMKGFNIF